jgi:hypothetical protein
LPSQQNDVVATCAATTPSSLEERKPESILTVRKPGFGVSILAERKAVSERKPSPPADRDMVVQMKDVGLIEAVSERQDVAVRGRSSVRLMDGEIEMQIAAMDEEGSEIVSLSTSKEEEMGESGMLAGGGDRSERGVELPRPYSTDPEQLLEELGLSSLSPSPSHSHSVNLSPTASTHQSLGIQPGDGAVNQSAEQLSMEQDGLLTEDLSVSHDDLSVGSISASERLAPRPGDIPDISTVKEKSSTPSSPPPVVAAGPRPTPPARDSSLTTPAAESAPDTPPPPPPAQNIQHVSSTLATRDSIATPQQDLGRITSPGDDKPISITEQETPSDDTLSESEDRASVGDAPTGTSSALTDKALATVVLHLLSTLNQHLSVDAESADLMYSVPGGSDNMKVQINSSSVLQAKLTKYVV